MKTFRIDMDLTVGTDIREAAQRAITLASLRNTRVRVKFVFNGVPITVTKKSDVAEVVQEYHRILEERHAREVVTPSGYRTLIWDPFAAPVFRSQKTR